MRFTSLRMLDGRAALAATLVSLSFGAAAAACSSGESTTQTNAASSSAVGSGGATAASSSSSSSAESSSSAGGGGASSSSSSVASSSSSSSSSSSAGSGGAGGQGGAGGAAPVCDPDPAGATSHSLHDIWVANSSTPVQYWVPGVYVTAVSKGGCVAGTSCQIFVQQLEQFASLAAGSQQALKIFISAAKAADFTGIAAGDRIDLNAQAWRDTSQGANELLFEVTQAHLGCAKKVGTGTPVPVLVTLDDLSVTSYENTIGPLLVKVNTVTGTPAGASETFGLYKTGSFVDAGADTLTSLSPFFLTTGAFNGLTTGQRTDFASVTGVFGLFSPTAMPTAKYEEIYPRSDADYASHSPSP